jgi:hypothetical protein
VAHLAAYVAWIRSKLLLLDAIELPENFKKRS